MYVPSAKNNKLQIGSVTAVTVHNKHNLNNLCSVFSMI